MLITRLLQKKATGIEQRQIDFMKVIGISTKLSIGHRKLLEALGLAFGVRFEELEFQPNAKVDGWFLHHPDRKNMELVESCDRPCYVIIDDDTLLPIKSCSTIQFAKHPALSEVLRGREVRSDEVAALRVLPKNLLTNKEALAWKAGKPVWAISEQRNRQHHFIVSPIPEVQGDEPLLHYLNGSKFLLLLPLVLFLRDFIKKDDWESPPLRACFMFDDPNLHWPTYGYIDFKQILKCAKNENYHVSFATIPLDSWYVNRKTADLFKQNQDRLSLLIHGNDHTFNELGRYYRGDERKQILLQAIARIAKLEHRSSIKVARVMAPPHGACSEAFLEEMSRTGFEAICVSNGSLVYHNKSADWLKTIGIREYDVVRGFPILPRFRLSKDCHNSILLAAVLNQPIIPVGHHHDLEEGLEILRETSGFINSLGTVHWMDLKSMIRSQYACKFSNSTLNIRIYSKRIEVPIPKSIDRVVIDDSRKQGVAHGSMFWRTVGEKPEWKQLSFRKIDGVTPGKRIEIADHSGILPPECKTNNLQFNLYPILRRQLTEARDRVLPAVHKVSKRIINR